MLKLGERGLVLLALCLFLTSCAGHHKPPLSARMDAATKRLSTAVEKATNTAELAKAKVDAAQKAADREATASASVLTQLAELKKVAPPELQERIGKLEGAVNEQQTAAGEVALHLIGAQGEHVTLGKELFEAGAAKMELEMEQGHYKREVAVVTDKWNAAEKQLAKEKVLKWVWRIAGGFVVLLIIAGVVLYFTGKLGVVLAKVGIKAAI